MQTVVFTIFAKNYLAHARALMDSVKRHHPEVGLSAVLVDHADGYFDPLAEDFEIVSSEELAIQASREFHFKYSLLELSTAVKPYAMQFLLDRHGAKNIVYFDPDILLYSSLDSILSGLQSHSFLLTPHLTSPLWDDRRSTELDILRSGAFNLGFLALRDGAESRALLSWWQSRLEDHCRVDLAGGLFVDQRWMDLAPGLFPSMGILRDPGCNVAYWNLSHCEVERRGEQWLVNGEPLVFFTSAASTRSGPRPYRAIKTGSKLSTWTIPPNPYFWIMQTRFFSADTRSARTGPTRTARSRMESPSQMPPGSGMRSSSPQQIRFQKKPIGTLFGRWSLPLTLAVCVRSPPKFAARAPICKKHFPIRRARIGNDSCAGC